MANVRMRGRVINKVTRQPINGVVVTLRRDSGGSQNVTVDVDGEFDYSVSVSSSSDKWELVIDKDAGYRYKVLPITFHTSQMSKDLGDIELEPYSD